MEILTQEEFLKRFKARMISSAGFSRFNDGLAVTDYADETAPSYFEEQHQQGYSPEECAEADMSYWGEE